MVDLLEITACSGQSWGKNPTASSYVLDSITVASIFGKPDLNINNVQHVDGITDTPKFVPSNDQHFHGSGSIIIEALDLGQIAISAWTRFDPNPRSSHPPSGSHINIDLYWYQHLPNETTIKGEIRDIHSYQVHGIACRKGRIRLVDLYNGGGEFSDHAINL